MDITHTVWSEKYRPQTVEDMLLQKKEKDYFSLSKTVENNMLFLGRPGTGKTTLAKILAKKFAPNSYIYINASEKSGVDVVRNEISDFISVQSFDGNQKIVILDEVDGTSHQFQAAIRGVMEDYLNDVRFILTGNFPHKVMDAIKSRCVPFSFTTDIKSVVARIVEIIKKENISVSAEEKQNLMLLIKKHFPDIRKTINELQRCCASGHFVYTDNSSTFIDSFWPKLVAKEDTFILRKYVIDNSTLFNNDYHFLMRQMFDKFIETENKEAILLIADYMEKDGEVKDVEVNFTGLLFNIAKIL
jgi:DNA polymerase III delta prime subunit